MEVHRLHRAAELLLLLEQLAGEALRAEEMPEQVRDGVGGLDVGQEQVGLLVLPELQPDAAIAVRGGERPLEVADVVVEGEGPRELLGRDVDVGRRLLRGHVGRPAHQGLDLREQLGRVGDVLRIRVGFMPLREEEVVAGVVAHDRALHRLRGPRRPIADGGDLPPLVGKDVPERLDLAHAAGDGEALARRAHRGEVADAVLVRSLAGGDRRPDDRAEQRLRAAEAAVRALLAELREVGQLALGHHQIDGLGVHPVEAQDDDAAAGGVPGAAFQEDDGDGDEQDGDGNGGHTGATGSEGHSGECLMPRVVSQARAGG